MLLVLGLCLSLSPALWGRSVDSPTPRRAARPPASWEQPEAPATARRNIADLFLPLIERGLAIERGPKKLVQIGPLRNSKEILQFGSKKKQFVEITPLRGKGRRGQPLAYILSPAASIKRPHTKRTENIHDNKASSNHGNDTVPMRGDRNDVHIKAGTHTEPLVIKDSNVHKESNNDVQSDDKQSIREKPLQLEIKGDPDVSLDKTELEVQLDKLGHSIESERGDHDVKIDSNIPYVHLDSDSHHTPIDTIGHKDKSHNSPNVHSVGNDDFQLHTDVTDRRSANTVPLEEESNNLSLNKIEQDVESEKSTHYVKSYKDDRDDDDNENVLLNTSSSEFEKHTDLYDLLDRDINDIHVERQDELQNEENPTELKDLTSKSELETNIGNTNRSDNMDNGLESENIEREFYLSDEKTGIRIMQSISIETEEDRIKNKQDLRESGQSRSESDASRSESSEDRSEQDLSESEQRGASEEDKSENEENKNGLIQDLIEAGPNKSWSEWDRSESEQSRSESDEERNNTEQFVRESEQSMRERDWSESEQDRSENTEDSSKEDSSLASDSQSEIFDSHENISSEIYLEPHEPGNAIKLYEELLDDESSIQNQEHSEPLIIDFMNPDNISKSNQRNHTHIHSYSHDHKPHSHETDPKYIHNGHMNGKHNPSHHTHTLPHHHHHHDEKGDNRQHDESTPNKDQIKQGSKRDKTIELESNDKPVEHNHTKHCASCMRHKTHNHNIDEEKHHLNSQEDKITSNEAQADKEGIYKIDNAITEEEKHSKEGNESHTEDISPEERDDSEAVPDRARHRHRHRGAHTHEKLLHDIHENVGHGDGRNYRSNEYLNEINKDTFEENNSRIINVKDLSKEKNTKSGIQEDDNRNISQQNNINTNIVSEDENPDITVESNDSKITFLENDIGDSTRNVEQLKLNSNTGASVKRSRDPVREQTVSTAPRSDCPTRNKKEHKFYNLSFVFNK